MTTFVFQSQVLDEIGIDVASAAPRAAGKKVAGKAAAGAQEEDASQQDIDELASRLANLRS